MILQIHMVVQTILASTARNAVVILLLNPVNACHKFLVSPCVNDKFRGFLTHETFKT